MWRARPRRARAPQVPNRNLQGCHTPETSSASRFGSVHVHTCAHVQRICIGIALGVRSVHVTAHAGSARRAHVRARHAARLVRRYGLLVLGDGPIQRTTVRRGSHAKWAALTGRSKLGLRPTWPTGHVHMQIGRARHGSISVTSRKKLAYGTLAGCGLQPGSARAHVG